jgi:hypothetical protein
MVVVPSRDNPYQGEFGEAWLRAVAAGCGLLHGTPATIDMIKGDVLLTLPEQVPGSNYPTVIVQVKTEMGLRRGSDGRFAYDLDVATYDVLRREDNTVRRVLAVIGLPREGERVRLHAEGTLLVGQGTWQSLEGEPPSSNRTTQVVYLPESNTLDGPGLDRMLRTYGVRTSTPVPDVGPWDVTEEPAGGEQ